MADMGRTLQLELLRDHPGTHLLGGRLLGITGMFLAVPIMVVVLVVPALMFRACSRSRSSFRATGMLIGEDEEAGAP